MQVMQAAAAALVTLLPASAVVQTYVPSRHSRFIPVQEGPERHAYTEARCASDEPGAPLRMERSAMFYVTMFQDGVRQGNDWVGKKEQWAQIRLIIRGHVAGSREQAFMPVFFGEWSGAMNSVLGPDATGKQMNDSSIGPPFMTGKRAWRWSFASKDLEIGETKGALGASLSAVFVRLGGGLLTQGPANIREPEGTPTGDSFITSTIFRQGKLRWRAGNQTEW